MSIEFSMPGLPPKDAPPTVRSMEDFLLSLRWSIWRPTKAGSSTFLASFPKTFVFDLENKWKLIKETAPELINPSLTFHHPADYKEMMAQIDYLCKHRDISPYRLIAFDTADALAEDYLAGGLVEEWNKTHTSDRERCTTGDIRDAGPSPEGAKGYGPFNRWLPETLHRLYILGYGWLVTGHKRVELISVKNADGSVGKVERLRPCLGPTFVYKVKDPTEVICDMKWQLITETFKDQLNIGGKTVVNERQVTRNVPCLVPETKSEGDVASGSNVRMPASIPLVTLGDGFGDLRRAMEKFISDRKELKK